MRSRRLSFVAGWVAVAVLAVAGFAAFGTPDEEPELDQLVAAGASIGHTAGAYAGLDFAFSDGAAAVVAMTTDTASGEAESESDASTATDDSASTGTASSPASDWLSEVEVRALVETYFEPQDVNRAVRIAWCESRFDPNWVDQRSGGVGLFNHLPRYWEERSANAGFTGVPATDPAASTAAAAWEVYNGAGWDIFTCR